MTALGQVRLVKNNTGQVCEPLGLERLGDLRVTSVHQEHGMIPLSGTDGFARLPAGARVRILPNHACLTAAAYDRYFVVEGDRVVDEWQRFNHW